mmetsp:Transcript_11322/g.17354  ORF Transcript_11322/g.17354 Transcript_11322/m.17354 type:complete len:90 (-) Transcript_11322:21-290(-)
MRLFVISSNSFSVTLDGSPKKSITTSVEKMLQDDTRALEEATNKNKNKNVAAVDIMMIVFFSLFFREGTMFASHVVISRRSEPSLAYAG